MPDYAGAVAAIQARLADNWMTTRIALPNTAPADPWPPLDPVTGTPAPWVLIEVACTGSQVRAAGKPGDQFWFYEGLVYVHVFVPLNYGDADARRYAVSIGEIFRNATFYNDTSGYQVRTLSPRVDGGDSGSDDGTWFRVTCTVPFEYYHRG